MAIELVNIYQNTSIIPDEVLSHRLGLIPIFAEANEFQYKKENEEFSEFNSIIFKLHVKYDKNDKTKDNEEVLSSKIEWTAIGNQAKRFVGQEIIRPVHDDILIAKLRPGQVKLLL
jgi:DNA-directed RNA polymerase I and III subunit RPAC1